MLLVKDISLNRLNRKIFENINFSLNPKSILILKGRNGSGKTSLLKILLNILKPSNGTIYWKGKILNKNLYDYFKNITYIADKTSSIRQLTVNENIKIWQKMFLSDLDLKQIESILSILDIKNFLNNKVSTLSLGEMKKLEFLRLIIENKKIWILDEPFSNLDSNSIRMVEDTFSDHCNNGGSIIFSSHQNPKIQVSNEILL